MTWNPSNPDTLGLEWLPTTSAYELVDANGKGPIENFRSASTETVTDLELFLTGLTGDGLFGVEVFASGNEVASAPLSFTVVPRTNTGSSAPDWLDYFGGSPDYWEVDSFAADDTGNRLHNASNASTVSPLVFRLGAGAQPATLTNKRILRVDLWIRWKYAGGTGVGGQATLEDPSSPGTFTVVGGTVTPPLGSAFKNARLARFDLNPFTNKPWTYAEAIAYFSSASTLAAGVTMGYNSLAGAIDVSAIWATVTYCTENRLAHGYRLLSELVAGDGWKAFPLTKPDGAANWAKANGAVYSIAFRRVGDSGSVSYPYAYEDGRQAPHAEHFGRNPSLDGFGLITSIGNELDRVRPVRMIVAGADSADSQPYTSAVALPVLNAAPARQELDQAAADDYGFVRIVLRPAVGSSLNLPDLTVSLRRESDSALMGTAITITRDEVDALRAFGGGWKTWEGSLGTPGTLAAGTRYYLELTMPAHAAEDFWQIAGATTGAKPDASYRGATNCATWGEFRDTATDLAITIGTVPVSPAGFAVALVP